MNDILSVARRMKEYANELGISDQKREDLLTAADGLLHLNAILNAVEKRKPDN